MSAAEQSPARDCVSDLRYMEVKCFCNARRDIPMSSAMHWSVSSLEHTAERTSRSRGVRLYRSENAARCFSGALLSAGALASGSSWGLAGLRLRGGELRQLYGFDLGLMPRGATHVFERVGNKEG